MSSIVITENLYGQRRLLTVCQLPYQGGALWVKSGYAKKGKFRGIARRVQDYSALWAAALTVLYFVA